MDLQDLKRSAIAAREFGVELEGADGPRLFTLRLPTRHEVVLLTRRSGLGDAVADAAAHVVMQRALLVAAVVAWSRVTVGDVLPRAEQAAELLPFEAGAVELLLDAQPDWETELGAKLLQRLGERRAQQDTAEKNS